jgi:hypothetical protein
MMIYTTYQQFNEYAECLRELVRSHNSVPKVEINANYLPLTPHTPYTIHLFPSRCSNITAIYTAIYTAIDAAIDAAIYAAIDAAIDAAIYTAIDAAKHCSDESFHSTIHRTLFGTVYATIFHPIIATK